MKAIDPTPTWPVNESLFVVVRQGKAELFHQTATCKPLSCESYYILWRGIT